MKLQFGIQPEKVKSNIESFEGYSKLSFKPFESNICGLILYLKSAIGILAEIPIESTNRYFSMPLKPYDFGWFEFTTTDHQYVIDVEIE